MKQLVLVVEGTSALRPHWPTIVHDYLEKIIRSFCGNGDRRPDSRVYLAYVNFNVLGSYTSFLVQRSNWINNIDVFLDWLSAIKFNDGGYCDAAIAEGLAEVLNMFPIANAIQNPRRHCILIAASNPNLPPTFSIQQNYIGTHLDGSFTDAQTVAETLKQYSVSLSVICPRQLPKLRAIYNAGRMNPSETDPTIPIAKNPDYMVLISESFMEARVVLNQPEIANLPPKIIIDSNLDCSPSTSLGNNIPPSTLKERRLSGRTESAALPDNVATNVGPAQERTSTALDQPDPAAFVKIWEGDFFAVLQGQRVFITKLEAYTHTKDSESIAKDWPSTVQIDTLTNLDDVLKILGEYKGKVDYVTFVAINEHFALLQMKEMKFCAVITLPSQMLFLSVSDINNALFGMVFPKKRV